MPDNGINLSGILSGAVNFANNLFNIGAQSKANAQNVAYMKQINAQNLAWQTKENEITRMREDNAVQRAAADMQAAGLSKTLAAGSPASASNLTAFQGQAPSINAVRSDINPDFILDIIGKAQQIKDNHAINVSNIELNEAAKKLTLSQVAGKDIENSYLGEKYNLENALNVSLLEMRSLEKEAKRLENEVAKGSKDAKIKLNQVNAEMAELQKFISDYDFRIAKNSNMPTGYLSNMFGGAAATLNTSFTRLGELLGL